MAESTPENSPEVAATAEDGVGDVPPAVAPIEAAMGRLPTFARGLLQIRVPLQVTLAAQRKSIQEIIELGPGSIVKFDKTCDQPLELSIGDRTIAEGDVVKVGDKFGLRISSLVK
jgi:flagellar motor switch protein FliN/FliY